LQRPTGVTILAILSAIGGVFSILAGVALLGLGALAGSAGAGDLGGLTAIFGIVFLALGVAELALAYGFWGLKPWAWTLGIALAVISLALIVIQAVLSNNIVGSLTGSIVSIVIWAVVIWYLWQPQIKAAFGRS
jgi:hypothetical protein